MDGAGILVASMSVPQPRGRSKALWQYNSRSDLHSKVACWGVLFDLLQQSRLMRQHARAGKIIFGVNFEMTDFRTNRPKALDLVIARPVGAVSTFSLADQASTWRIVLSSAQATRLANLPLLYEGGVGAVLMALEAKAAMTEHVKAKPRLYDELNSSHHTVHGASSQALAVGLVMVNISNTFISSDRNRRPPGPGVTSIVNVHKQPHAAEASIAKVRETPRRSSGTGDGYDGLGLVVVDVMNDNVTPVRLITAPPASQRGDVLFYDGMITRVANEYDSVFRHI